MKSAILRLKKNSTKSAILEIGSPTTCLIKWSDLNCMPKLTACGTQMRTCESFHGTNNLSEKFRIALWMEEVS